jgi:hypothetical protein
VPHAKELKQRPFMVNLHRAGSCMPDARYPEPASKKAAFDFPAYPVDEVTRESR